MTHRPQREAQFPLGASVTVAELEQDPHPVLRRLRAAEPVSWLPALDGWLVTRADLAAQVLRGPGAFTVDHPRFTTARVVGPSMLSLDGTAHRHHRDPFDRPLRSGEPGARLAAFAAAEAARLVAALAPDGAAELRRGLAGELAVGVMVEVLGLDVDRSQLLAWYDAIVAGVSALADTASGNTVPASAQTAFAELGDCVLAAIARGGHASLLGTAAGGLTDAEVVSNAAVLLFGGIETTEGMICNAVWYLLRDPAEVAAVTSDPALAEAVVEESLRLEPAAAVVDRYATADIRLGGAQISEGDLVTVSLAGANRDPALFTDPDRFDLRRPAVRRHLAFAVGPHFCLGAQLARQEARAAVTELLARLPGLRLDPDRPSAPHGLVFRKPRSLHVRWETP
jgi:cytochrome P450